MTARRLAEGELNNRIDTRIARHSRWDRLTYLEDCERWEFQRREAWKRLARQAAIDRSGVCTGSSADCPCPNCIEYRDFWKLRPGERIAKVHTAFGENRLFKWIWVRHGGGWQKMKLGNNGLFGPVIQHVNPDAICVTEHHIRTRTVGAISIQDETIICETNPNRADYGLDTPWADPPQKSDLVTPKAGTAFLHGDWSERKELTMLTALQIAILCHFNVHPGVPYPYTSPAGNVGEALTGLVAGEFLEWSLSERAHQLTARALTFLRAVEALPLPVRKPQPWVMPS